MTDSGAQYAPPAAFAPTRRPGRQSMVLRHLASAGIALAVTPIGLTVFDYGAFGYLRTQAYGLSDGEGSVGKFVVMFVGGLLLTAVAATARLSGLGPILAALLWAFVPFLWFVIDTVGFYSTMDDLPSTHFWFSNPPLLFGTVGAMLLGSGLAGRWRGARR